MLFLRTPIFDESNLQILKRYFSPQGFITPCINLAFLFGFGWQQGRLVLTFGLLIMERTTIVCK